MELLNKTRLFIFIFVISLAIVIPAGCGASGSNLGTGLIISGSSSVQPLAQELADEYYKRNVVPRIDVSSTDSSLGLQNAKDGTIDIGTSSRELKPEEKRWNLVEQVIAYDGIAIIVNKSNSIPNIKRSDIKDIFSGKITNWKEIGGADLEIRVITRELGSGTRGSFEQLLDITSISAQAVVANGSSDVKAHVQSEIASIGYISMGFVNNSIKALAIDGIEPSISNVNLKKYDLIRPFVLVWKEPLKIEGKNLLDFILSDEGQKIVSKKYIPIARR